MSLLISLLKNHKLTQYHSQIGRWTHTHTSEDSMTTSQFASRSVYIVTDESAKTKQVSMCGCHRQSLFLLSLDWCWQLLIVVYITRLSSRYIMSAEILKEPTKKPEIWSHLQLVSHRVIKLSELLSRSSPALSSKLVNWNDLWKRRSWSLSYQ